jgi:hypothetical protein
LAGHVQVRRGHPAMGRHSITARRPSRDDVSRKRHPTLTGRYMFPRLPPKVIITAELAVLSCWHADASKRPTTPKSATGGDRPQSVVTIRRKSSRSARSKTSNEQNVRDGSIASIHDGPVYVRFTPDSDRTADMPDWPLRARKRRTALQQLFRAWLGLRLTLHRANSLSIRAISRKTPCLACRPDGEHIVSCQRSPDALEHEFPDRFNTRGVL